MIDVQGIVTKLMAIEQRPYTVLNGRIKDVNVSISAMGEIKAKVDSLYVALGAVQDASVLPSKSVSSSDESAVKATVTGAAAAVPGKITVVPIELAAAQVTSFKGFTKEALTDPSAFLSDVAGANTFRIKLDSTGFSDGFSEEDIANGVLTRSFAVYDGTVTLEALVKQINEDVVLSSRVRASIVNTGDGSASYALVLTGVQTGEAKKFSVEVDVGGEGPVGGGAASDPRQSVGPSNPSNVSWGRIQRSDVLASSAEVKVQGLSVKSNSNVFADALPGVSFEVFKKAPLETFSLNIAKDNAAMLAKVKAFAAALTDLLKRGQELTKPGTEDQAAGPLAGNNGMLSLLSAVRSSYQSGFSFNDPLVVEQLKDTALKGRGSVEKPLYWSALGLDVSRDGTVSVNESSLTSALSGPLGSALFTGFNASLRTVLRSFQGTSGSVYSVIDSMRLNVKTLTVSKSDMEDRLEKKRAALLQQYASLDAKLVGMNQQMSGVRSALAGLSR